MRALRLNCLTTHYADLWNRNWSPALGWSSSDPRLSRWPKNHAPWSREAGRRGLWPGVSDRDHALRSSNA